MRTFYRNASNTIHATLILSDNPIEHTEQPETIGNVTYVAHLGTRHNLVQLELSMTRDAAAYSAKHVHAALRQHTWCPPQETLSYGNLSHVLAALKARALRN